VIPAKINKPAAIKSVAKVGIRLSEPVPGEGAGELGADVVAALGPLTR
jgi:hypothetical protein